jgi:hypothetical protein
MVANAGSKTNRKSATKYATRFMKSLFSLKEWKAHGVLAVTRVIQN